MNHVVEFFPASQCRASGESLAAAQLLFELTDCPFPGIYPGSAAESKSFRSPLRVVQARQSGLVQLAHVFDPACYQEYLFAGSVSPSYRTYLEDFAHAVAAAFPRTAAVLEVGCGDGTLLHLMQSVGFSDILGIDPGQPARQKSAALPIVGGYFPADFPAERSAKKYDLIITRHVLEHVETPRDFVVSMAAHLKPTGQLWIEVPDLASAVRRQIWSNFYQTHCSYFEAATLDALLGKCGLTCCGGEVVEIFGGSLLRRYEFGLARAAPAATRWDDLATQVGAYQRQLFTLAERMPAGCVGYGAAERTAVMIGFCPALAARLQCVYDGNSLLAGRFLGGTSLPIAPKTELFQNPPTAVLLFAISHANEIIAEFKANLPSEVLIGLAGADFRCAPLADFPGK
jgi:SAM-dependent methyltransferase